MAAIDISGARTYHGTLTTNQADALTCRAGVRDVTIINRSTTDAIWVRLDGVAAAVAAAGTYAVLVSNPSVVPSFAPLESTAAPVIQIISAGTNVPYSIIA